MDIGVNNWFDPLFNPNGDWKLTCLLQLKLPPRLPRLPDFVNPAPIPDNIPWNIPCLDANGNTVPVTGICFLCSGSGEHYAR